MLSYYPIFWGLIHQLFQPTLDMPSAGFLNNCLILFIYTFHSIFLCGLYFPFIKYKFAVIILYCHMIFILASSVIPFILVVCW